MPSRNAAEQQPAADHPPDSAPTQAASFPIVGVGTSADGLEALTELLQNLPPDPGLAFILVQDDASQHAGASQHEGKLAEVLAGACSIPVIEARDGLKVIKNRICVLPPNAELALRQDVLQLSPWAEAREHHHPIDDLFRVLAQEHRARAIGVVLSVAGSDGNNGLREIKSAGGITFVQSEAAGQTARPRSVVEPDCVDFILPPAEIARRLAAIAQHPYLSPWPASAREPSDRESQARILAAVRMQTGVDFSLYRETNIVRRILRRMALHGFGSASAYAERVTRDPLEAEALYSDLLINVTRFFRDPKLFDLLKAVVFPALAAARTGNEPLRVWVPGCSSGEEAYSLAMALVEYHDAVSPRPTIQIFGTDLNDKTALDKARAGLYPETIADQVSPERLQRFFQREGRSFRIQKSIRDLCIFARQDVTADPPISHVDLISCRNLLMHMTAPLQKRLVVTFHYALRVPGYLVLGSAESAGESAGLFELQDDELRLYSKQLPSTRQPPFFLSPDYPAPHERPPVPRAPDLGREPEHLPTTQADAPCQVVHLHQELAALREYTRTLIEQHEASNQQLRAAHQEVLSSNEELQSLNDELEAVREALRSANEDLTSINHQLQRRNQELDRANSDLSNLLSSSNIPVVIVDGELRIRHFTPAAGKVLKLQPNDLGRAISDVRPVLDLPELVELITGVIGKATSAEREVYDRQRCLYSLRISPYRTISGRVEGAVLMLLDIEHMRQSQEELRRQAALIELSLDAIIVRDARNRILSWNQGAQKIYGWSSAEALGKPLAEVLRTDADVWEALNAQLDRAGMWEGELRQRRRDGTPIIIHSREVLVRDESGARAAVLSIKRDITERRRLIEALEEADHVKDEFLSILAHELRNPLAPLRNVVHLLRGGPKNTADVLNACEMLDRQVTQLTRIVDDLTDVSRITERKIELRRECVLVSSVVETALETCRSLIDGAGHQLHVTLPDEPVTLIADPVRLAQVIINLLNNAAKFTPPGGQITLSAERVWPMTDRPRLGPWAHGQLVIRVSDSGVGIAPEVLPNIFDLFIQGHAAREQSRGGLGVGLALVRNLIHMHGGSVEANSDGPGRGAEFIVRLPLAPEVAPATATSAPDPVGKPSGGGETAKRVLVVDDNRDLAGSLAMLLKLSGHEVHAVHDGEAALQALEAFEPNVAIVDIGLPGISGYDVARRVRENPRFKQILLVAQTGWGQEEDRRRSKNAGFDHHVVKPVEADTILQLLESRPS